MPDKNKIVYLKSRFCIYFTVSRFLSMIDKFLVISVTDWQYSTSKGSYKFYIKVRYQSTRFHTNISIYYFNHKLLVFSV